MKLKPFKIGANHATCNFWLVNCFELKLEKCKLESEFTRY